MTARMIRGWAAAMRRGRSLLPFLIGVVLAFAPPARAQPAPALVRLYAIDCGRLDYPDMKGFSDTDDYDGQPGSLVVPCFLVGHGAEWLLWDTGVGDHIAALPNGEFKEDGRFTLQRTLAMELARIGLGPDDMHLVALLHLHAGNIGLFPHSTFLIAAAELLWARGRPTPEGVEASQLTPLDRARIRTFDKDLDVFGDGTVRILTAPGHTPGHAMLLLKLPKAGPVLVTGDLFHMRRSMEAGLVPRVNVSRADTLASIVRWRQNTLLKAGGAYRNDYAWFFTMRDGRVTAITAFLDLPAYAAATGADA